MILYTTEILAQSICGCNSNSPLAFCSQHFDVSFVGTRRCQNRVTTPAQRPQSHSLQPDQNSPPSLLFLHCEHYHNNAVNSWLFYLTQLQDTSVLVFPLTIQDVSPSIPSANNIFIYNTVTVLGSLQSPFQAIKPCICHF